MRPYCIAPVRSLVCAAFCSSEASTLPRRSSRHSLTRPESCVGRQLQRACGVVCVCVCVRPSVRPSVRARVRARARMRVYVRVRVQVKKYGLSMMITTDNALLDYLRNVLSQLSGVLLSLSFPLHIGAEPGLMPNTTVCRMAAEGDGPEARAGHYESRLQAGSEYVRRRSQQPDVFLDPVLRRRRCLSGGTSTSRPITIHLPQGAADLSCYHSRHVLRCATSRRFAA
jgi:hypothetical protein